MKWPGFTPHPLRAWRGRRGAPLYFCSTLLRRRCARFCSVWLRKGPQHAQDHLSALLFCQVLLLLGTSHALCLGEVLLLLDAFSSLSSGVVERARNHGYTSPWPRYACNDRTSHISRTPSYDNAQVSRHLLQGRWLSDRASRTPFGLGEGGAGVGVRAVEAAQVHISTPRILDRVATALCKEIIEGVLARDQRLPHPLVLGPESVALLLQKAKFATHASAASMRQSSTPF